VTFVDVRGTLTEAVRLHQAGQIDKAALLYRRVLAADPGNPDALHLLGMAALQQGQAREAADLIGKAIARHDRDASYHFHHALALQTLQDMDGAVAGYKKAMALEPDNPDIYNNMGNALAAQHKLEDAKAAFLRLLALQPAHAIGYSNLGNVQRDLGLRDEAEASFRKATALQPGLTAALVNLGNLLQDRDEPEQAESCYRRALASSPREAAAHTGLGVALWQMGRHGEAQASYRAALSLDPGNAEALVNLGGARWADGALDEAETLYMRAVTARPRDPAILDKAAALLAARGKDAAAMELVHRSLASAQTPTARKLFVQLARRSQPDDGEMRHAMARALAEAWDRPGTLTMAAARLLRADPVIGPCVARANSAWPDSRSLVELLGEAGFSALSNDALLMALLISAPNTDIPLERFLTLLRGAMLRELAQVPAPDESMLAFAAALAQQCFINEYVFAATDAELAAARALVETPDAATPMQLLLAAAWFPLHALDSAQALAARIWPAPVENVITQQIREPLNERLLRADIPRLTGIGDTVSQRVQQQYEENPYPRWVRAAPETPGAIAGFITGKFPHGGFVRPAQAMQDILIAGCGTGQRAIAMARRFGDRNLLAIDLSLASLGYARRKSQEAGLRIAYGQADILELDTLGRQFDLIESLGVLHHLDDPFAGWKALLSCLRPGGVMLLGLYSETARRPVAAARERIAARGLEGSAADIRAFRQALMQDGDASILESEDFFSLSACRDLLFHVQEHRLTLAQIARFVRTSGLHVLGFELEDAVLDAYRRRFPQDAAATDLTCWEAFEVEHPGLFGGMYIFWIQKPA
jgi:Flp pilus assembly protein TadD/2-polyprenyl-3-methyl-5-hydroxy-6-metoxy-1,4-benzoquinol methylase